MIKQYFISGLILSSLSLLFFSTPALPFDADVFNEGPSMGNHYGPKKLKAWASGLNEVPALSSSGSGRFEARISDDHTAIDYTLSYQGMEGKVFMAHIHIGQHFANGGISYWFCGDPASAVPPPPTVSVPICDPTSGTLQGTIRAADILGPNGQGIAPGEFDEFIHLLRRGMTYVNIHSDKHAPGEIRGQIMHHKR